MHNFDLSLNEYKFNPDLLNNPNFDSHSVVEFEYENYSESDNEDVEIELANELLAVHTEKELDQFLSKLIKNAAHGESNFTKSPVGEEIVADLKLVAEKIEGLAGTALGGPLGDSAGSHIGGLLGNKGATLFQLKLEGMPNDDRKFEVARRFVKFANMAAKNAFNNRGLNTKPLIIVMHSLKIAAIKFAPGMLVKRL